MAIQKEKVLTQPSRQDVTVIPADDPFRKKIGWIVKEKIGAAAINPRALPAFVELELGKSGVKIVAECWAGGATAHMAFSNEPSLRFRMEASNIRSACPEELRSAAVKACSLGGSMLASERSRVRLSDIPEKEWPGWQDFLDRIDSTLAMVEVMGA